MAEIPDEVRKDENKMNSLYSPIRSEIVNPTDRISKVSFWKKVIGEYCKKNSQYTISLSVLKVYFHVDGRSPQCLEEVLKDMLQCKDCISLPQYLQKSPASWSSWITHVLIKKTLSFSFSKLKDFVYGENYNDAYVHLGILAIESDRLMTVMPSKFKDEVLSLDDLVNILQSDFPRLDVQNAKLLVNELVNKSKADMKVEYGKDNQSLCLVKLYSANINPISEVDIGIYKLVEKEKCLAQKTEELEIEINSLKEIAKNYIKKAHRHTAMTYLKKKNEVKKRMEKNSDALHNIQVMLEHLRISQTNHLVVQSYKEAVSSFKHTSKSVNEDEVHDIMDDIYEMLNINEDNAAALSKSLSEDDPSLEQELDELLKEEENQAEGDSNIITAMENLNITTPDTGKQNNITLVPTL